jgi:hypothetical protein
MIKLLVSYPHRWGLGKIHGMDRKTRRTWCGLDPHAQIRDGAYEEITCRDCLSGPSVQAPKRASRSNPQTDD